MKISQAAEEAVREQKKQEERNRPKPEFVGSDERNGDQRTLTKIVNDNIKTLDELKKVCRIDTSQWEIYRWKCVAWQTGMKPPAIGETGSWSRRSDKPIYSHQFAVTAWMRLKRSLIAAASEIEQLAKKSIGHTPKYPKSPSLRDSGNMAEFSLSDHHFGALIWGKETGGADYDTGIAKAVGEDALTTLMRRVEGFTPKKALIVFGNDQQNADNRAGSTEKGTSQVMDSRYQKVFTASRDFSIWAIDALLSRYAQVQVVMVGGNHDPLTTWHLGMSLELWYRRCDRVKVDNRPLFRKYHCYGVNMLMFTHGHGGKLEDYGKTMAAEQPDMWGKTHWREAHTGDKHHRRVIELSGATVRILPSLRPPCAWSSENNFVGNIRAAEAYVWNERDGLVGTGVYSIQDK